jgi:hypothetical protein
MKKFIVISAFLVGIAGVASAAPVMCAVLMEANLTGRTGSTCTVIPAGFYISSLTLTGIDDYCGLRSGFRLTACQSQVRSA